MKTWTATSHALPQEGDLVQFVVESRNIVLRGTFEQNLFKARWSHYAPEEVGEWRKLGEAPASWALTLKMIGDSLPKRLASEASASELRVARADASMTTEGDASHVPPQFHSARRPGSEAFTRAP